MLLSSGRWPWRCRRRSAGRAGAAGSARCVVAYALAEVVEGGAGGSTGDVVGVQGRHPVRRHVDRAGCSCCRRAAAGSEVVLALVVVLPKKLCMCDAPGRPGKTIGSSGSRWVNGQSARNSATRTIGPPGGGVVGARRRCRRPGTPRASSRTGWRAGAVHPDVAAGAGDVRGSGCRRCRWWWCRRWSRWCRRRRSGSGRRLAYAASQFSTTWLMVAVAPRSTWSHCGSLKALDQRVPVLPSTAARPVCRRSRPRRRWRGGPGTAGSPRRWPGR